MLSFSLLESEVSWLWFKLLTALWGLSAKDKKNKVKNSNYWWQINTLIQIKWNWAWKIIFEGNTLMRKRMTFEILSRQKIEKGSM